MFQFHVLELVSALFGYIAKVIRPKNVSFIRTQKELGANLLAISLLGTQVRFTSLYMQYSKLNRCLGDGKLP